jgi:hypothetical protein
VTGDDPGADQRPPRRPTERPDRSEPVLPDRTRDEESLGWGEREYDEDEHLRREVPPHHR